ncbi:MAG: polysaccharide biosynthesis/export family protein, partial [Gemmatimonadetes bacterium]|nr:polysaccharide biosynthesis/export family protein [Gemmatimonadota bacterium]
MKQLTFVAVAILHLMVASLAGAQASGGNSETVTLLPGDVVRVAIWREEDLSGEFPVNENGTVIFPLLGEKPVTDIPFPELRTMLMDEYRVHLRNPSITITPLRRVNVLGEVNKPGLYEVDPTISLAGVVALAGGTNPGGDLGRIRIVRSGAVLHERVSAMSSLHSFDVRSGDQIFVDRRGWFDRNST